MPASNPDRGSEPVSAPMPCSPDELIKDLELSEDEQRSVVGGEYLILKMNDVIITNVAPGSASR